MLLCLSRLDVRAVVPPGIYPARTVDEGRYLTVHWLRTDPSGLVRPLPPPISLTTPQASTPRLWVP